MLYILSAMWTMILGLAIFYAICAALWLYGRTWRMNEAEEVLMRIREQSRVTCPRPKGV